MRGYTGNEADGGHYLDELVRLDELALSGDRLPPTYQADRMAALRRAARENVAGAVTSFGSDGRMEFVYASLATAETYARSAMRTLLPVLDGEDRALARIMPEEGVAAPEEMRETGFNGEVPDALVRSMVQQLIYDEIYAAASGRDVSRALNGTRLLDVYDDGYLQWLRRQEEAIE